MKNKVIIICLILSLVLASFTFVYCDPGENSEEPILSNSTENDIVLLDSSDLRITASETTGLQSIILSLIGDYEPIVKDYVYYTTNYQGQQVTNHTIDIQPDYSWIASACVFIAVVWCCFRFLGALISGR